MRLYILRHAKAERESPTGRDEDRPLAAVGLHQARYLGRSLAEAEVKPDRIITSPAERAARTADIIAGALGLQPEPDARLSPEAPYASIAAVARRLADEATPAMIVGHNPVLEELVLGLTAGQPDAPDGLRTGELVVVELSAAGRGLQARFVDRLRFGEEHG